VFRESGISAAILIISMNAEADFIEQSLANGANGFMYKDEMGNLLTEAIRTVHNKEQYLSPKAKNVLTHEED
jgi:DNA-binding NarL/FixJ family response regulator